MNKRNNSPSTIEIALAIASVALFLLVALGIALLLVPTNKAVLEVSERMEVTDRQADRVNSLPYYSQDDEGWAFASYGQSTISEGGCGLCVAAATFSVLTGHPVDPYQLSDTVGNDMLDDSFMNDMLAFAEFGEATMQLSHSEKLFMYEDILTHLEAGHYVWVGIEGWIADNYYNSHVICIYDLGIGTYELMGFYDPKDSSATVLTLEQFYQADILYAVSVWKD